MNLTSIETKTAWMIRLSGFTDVGKIREHNEDDYRICCDLEQGIWGHSQEERNPLSKSGALMVVADGMGGADAGEIASRIAVEAVKNYFLELTLNENATDDAIRDHLKLAFNKALQAISAAIEINPALYKMGTTLTVAWLMPQGLYLAWIGDSRAYLFNKNGRLNLQVDHYKNCSDRLKILTDDHSLVWQEVIKTKGAFSAEQARVSPESNIILRCLGNEYLNDEPDLVGPIKIQNNDRILLCSDGLNGMLPDVTIEELIAKFEDDLDAGSALLEAANQAGGKDNITILLASIFGPENNQLSRIESAPSKLNQSGKISPNARKRWSIAIGITLVILGLVSLFIYVNKKSLNTSYLIDYNMPNSNIDTLIKQLPTDSALKGIKNQVQDSKSNNNGERNIQEGGLNYEISNPLNNSDTIGPKGDKTFNPEEVEPKKNPPIELTNIPQKEKLNKLKHEYYRRDFNGNPCLDNKLIICGSAFTKVVRYISYDKKPNNYYYNSEDGTNNFKKRIACNEAELIEVLRSNIRLELTIEFNLMRKPGESCKDATIIKILAVSSDKDVFKK